MSGFQVLLIEIFFSLALSLAVIAYERDVMLELLQTACPQGGARFWMKILGLLQLMVPLLLVVWRADLDLPINPVLEFRSALSWMLVGHCFALLMIARKVWRAFVEPAMLAQKLERIAK